MTCLVHPDLDCGTTRPFCITLADEMDENVSCTWSYGVRATVLCVNVKKT